MCRRTATDLYGFATWHQLELIACCRVVTLGCAETIARISDVCPCRCVLERIELRLGVERDVPCIAVVSRKGSRVSLGPLDACSRCLEERCVETVSRILVLDVVLHRVLMFIGISR